MFVYLDESGDLGFSDGSSKYFVITLLKTKDEKKIGRCIKKIRQRKLKKKLKQVPELKAYNSTPHIRKKLLKDLSECNIDIHCIVLPKEKVFPHLRYGVIKYKLYNYVTGMLLPGALAFNRKVTLTVDRLTSKKIIRDDFDGYIQAKIEERSFFPKPQIEIKHLDSKNSPGLQACDFICWSVFRKYETGDESYYTIIRKKIKEEYMMFK